MPDHAFEISFDAASQSRVEAQWAALQSSGLPSQADHRAMVNAPHLTLVAARGIDPALVPWATEQIGPLLPVELHLRGLVLLGTGPRITIAHLVEPPAALAQVTALLRARVPTLRQPVWMPHVTLARRVPRRRVAEALAVLSDPDVVAPSVLVGTRLRWWDPDEDTIEDLAARGPSA